jgi:hypothetical protein
MKEMLTLEALEAQTALELPERETMLVTIVITNLLNNLSVDVDVKNNNVAVQVCAIVELIDSDLLGGNVLTCDIQQ